MKNPMKEAREWLKLLASLDFPSSTWARAALNALEGMMSKITLVKAEGGDWEVLYVDGQKRCEAHSLKGVQVLSALEGVTVDKLDIKVVTDRFAENFPFPERLENIPADVYMKV